jgi:hypothetical protein
MRQNRTLLAVSCWCLSVAFSQGTSQASIDACDATLVAATVHVSESSHRDWRISYLITKENYDEVKRAFGFNAVIDDVPLGATFDDFRANRGRTSLQYGESLTTDEARTVARTGLDEKSASAYKACLQTRVWLSNGIHAAIISETANDLVLDFVYKVPGGAAFATISWDPPQVGGQKIKTTVANAGERRVVLIRPKSTMSLVGNFNGYSTEAITLLPSPIPERSPSKPEAESPLYVGLDANCNAGEVTMALGQKNCSNLPIGHSAKEGDIQLYWGTTDYRNRGMATIRPSFLGGQTAPLGFTLNHKPDPTAIELFVVLAGRFPNCDANAGQVTVSSSQLGCDTRSIGWILP